IPPTFDSAEAFSEGLAAVSQNEKFGFIDRSGTLVIAPQFWSASGFSDGRAAVSELTKEHKIVNRYITPRGAAAFPGTFMFANGFAYGLAHVSLSKGQWAWINASGKPVFRYEFK